MAEDAAAVRDSVALLRDRGRHTRWFGLAVCALYLGAEPVAGDHLALERALVATGNLLIVAGGLLRVYATLFIGGWKNQRLTAAGPYAVVRNPLYLGSLIATTGVGLVTASGTLTLLMLAFIMAYCKRTVAREEAYLEQTFGADYLAYKRAVPRWWPRAGARLTVPAETLCKPRYVLNSIRDLTLVLLVTPLCEAVRIAHQVGWLPSFYPLW